MPPLVHTFEHKRYCESGLKCVTIHIRIYIRGTNKVGNVTDIAVKRSPSKPVASKAMHAKPARSQRLMSDVIRPPKRSSVPKPIATAKPAAKPVKLAPAPANSLKPHKAQPATTLMRRAVTKPKPGLKKQLHVQPALVNGVATKPVTPKPSVHAIDVKRLGRSQHVAKSQQVQKFAPEKKSWFSGHESAAIPVQKPSEAAKAAATSSRHSMDIFSRAVATARSHEQTFVDPKKHTAKANKAARELNRDTRLVIIVTSLITVFLLATAIAWHYQPQITLSYVNAKAGMSASLPSTVPTGYHISKFSYHKASVTIQYSRTGTSREFSLSQSTSSLTSEGVRDMVVPKNSSFQTLQNGGRTIYLFGNNNAAWVSEGILYQITSNGNMSTSDLVSIATDIRR